MTRFHGGGISFLLLCFCVALFGYGCSRGHKAEKTVTTTTLHPEILSISGAKQDAGRLELPETQSKLVWFEPTDKQVEEARFALARNPQLARDLATIIPDDAWKKDSLRNCSLIVANERQPDAKMVRAWLIMVFNARSRTSGEQNPMWTLLETAALSEPIRVGSRVTDMHSALPSKELASLGF